MSETTEANTAAAAGQLHAAPDDPTRIEADLPSACVQNHAANLAALPNGDIGCVWFGGTQEGVADVSIYFSRLPKGESRWTASVRLSDDATRSEQNPILFPTPDGKLWLLYTAQRSGNQDTAIVRCRVSTDNGSCWGPVTTLIDTPGTFVRQPVVVLDNGDWLLPVFHCRTAPGEKWVGDHDTSSVLISTDAGRTWTRHEVPNSTGCVHMNIVRMPGGALLAFFRSRWADFVYSSRSSDSGRTWSDPTPTSLPNNNSSIQCVRLASGHLAIVFNDMSAAGATERRTSLYDEIEDDEPVDAAAAEPAVPTKTSRTAFWGAPRAPLTLAISEDGGATWPYRRDLAVGDGYCMTNDSAQRRNREYSYPSIIQTADGALHIAYTYFRQLIRYVRVDEGWVHSREAVTANPSGR